MSVINTNVSSLLAQTALKQSQSKLQTALTRLSTGLQINSGADNPAGLIAAQTLGAQVTAMNQSIANAQQGNDIVSTADAALAQISNQLNSIRGLVQAAANKGGVSASEISADQQQVDAALQSISSIGQTTVFGGQNLLNGSLAYQVSEAGGSAGPFNSTNDITVNSFNPALHTATPGNDVAIAVTHAATQRTVTLSGSALGGLTAGGATQSTRVLEINGTTGLANSTGPSAANTALSGASGALSFKITGLNGTSATINVSNTDEAALAAGTSGSAVDTAAGDIVNSINAQTNATGVIAAYTSGGDITLTAAKYGSTGTIGITAATNDGGALADALGTQTTGSDATTTNTTTINLAGDVGSAVVSVNNDALLSGSNALVNAINAVSSTTGITASLAPTSSYGANTPQHAGSDYQANIVLTSQNYGSSAILSANAISATNSSDVTLFNGGGTQTAVAGTNAAGTVTTQDGTNAFTAIGNNISYSDSNISLSAIANPTLGTGTAAFDVTGGALFQIGTNVDFQDQVNINIQGIDLATLGLNSTTDPNNALSSLQSGGLNQLSSSNLTNAANIVNQAINQVATIRGQLGSLQTYVFQSNINSLQTSVSQVTQAQSDIQDTNFAAETAALTQAQILVQAGTSVLSIANSRPQSVLSLLPH